MEIGKMITFDQEAFVKTRKNMQPFLRKILQSQIFQQVCMFLYLTVYFGI